ncbi:hypothetical protein EYF80_028980 [Liparis tanakae]|uniref:Uncharacterized protein n=1 Tax=Liparis tanakae TaxID=230148 RepID=A0A4Z2H5N0_9TELE|nr:hypothetical protein EYF80_028980 [Liparis tanakae]
MSWEVSRVSCSGVVEGRARITWAISAQKDRHLLGKTPALAPMEPCHHSPSFLLTKIKSPSPNVRSVSSGESTVTYVLGNQPCSLFSFPSHQFSCFSNTCMTSSLLKFRWLSVFAVHEHRAWACRLPTTRCQERERERERARGKGAGFGECVGVKADLAPAAFTPSSALESCDWSAIIGAAAAALAALAVSEGATLST